MLCLSPDLISWRIRPFSYSTCNSNSSLSIINAQQMFVKLNYLNDSKISCFGIGLTASYDSLFPPVISNQLCFHLDVTSLSYTLPLLLLKTSILLTLTFYSKTLSCKTICLSPTCRARFSLGLLDFQHSQASCAFCHGPHMLTLSRGLSLPCSINYPFFIQLSAFQKSVKSLMHRLPPFSFFLHFEFIFKNIY